jgi:hypothetical protein
MGRRVSRPAGFVKVDVEKVESTAFCLDCFRPGLDNHCFEDFGFFMPAVGALLRAPRYSVGERLRTP